MFLLLNKSLMSMKGAILHDINRKKIYPILNFSSWSSIQWVRPFPRLNPHQRLWLDFINLGRKIIWILIDRLWIWNRCKVYQVISHLLLLFFKCSLESVSLLDMPDISHGYMEHAFCLVTVAYHLQNLFLASIILAPFMYLLYMLVDFQPDHEQ